VSLDIAKRAPKIQLNLEPNSPKSKKLNFFKEIPKASPFFVSLASAKGPCWETAILETEIPVPKEQPHEESTESYIHNSDQASLRSDSIPISEYREFCNRLIMRRTTKSETSSTLDVKNDHDLPTLSPTLEFAPRIGLNLPDKAEQAVSILEKLSKPKYNRPISQG
jgi:hypothetical protein